MFFFRFLNANPDDGVAVMLCLITIWWCVRYVPRGPGPTRFVLAILGVLSACLGTKMLDAMISVAFLVAAIMLELCGPDRRLENVPSLTGLRKKSGSQNLAGESARPTLACKGLRFHGAGAFACQLIFSQPLTRGATNASIGSRAR